MKTIFTHHPLLWVILLLIIMTAPPCTAGHDQQILDREITLDLRDVPLSMALSEIEVASAVKFVYSASQLDLDQAVSVSARNKKLGMILNDLLGPLGIGYSVERGKEFILLKPVKARLDDTSIPGKPSHSPPGQTVTGRVTDAVTQQPIAGVNIVVKGTTSGTTTDSNGTYIIEAGDTDILVFSFIGYKKFEAAITGRSIIDVALEQDVASLKEVVINAGYYLTTEKMKTGNISKITAEEIENQPVTNPLMALQGRVPGLEITPRNGVPGSAPTIRIRGQNSLRNSLDENGNFPLYIIDGVPIDSSPLRSYSPGGFDPLATLNPENILSVEVLKDADATAIYGSRGANGVILITTKRGSSSGKTDIEIKGYTGSGKIVNRMELLNTAQYIALRREAFANSGKTPGPFDYDVNGSWDTTRYTNWQDMLLGGSAGIYDVQLAMAGGTGNTSFRLGSGYHKENTIYPGDFGYRSLTGNLSLSHVSPDKKFNADLSINYGTTNNKLFSSTFVQSAITLPPNAPSLYTAEGELNWDVFEYFGYHLNSWTNPLSELMRTHEVTNGALTTNANLSYQLIPDLRLKTNLGFTDANGSEVLKFPLSSNSPTNIFPSSTAQAVFGRNDRHSWIAEPQISYSKSVANHEVNIVIGSSFQSAVNKYESLRGNGYVSDVLLNTLQGATSTTILSDFNSKYKYSALFARIGYRFKEKYIINVTGRRDGSSRFGPNKRFGNFGAIGIAWLLTNEKFMADRLNFLSFGKIRASYGVAGNDQIGDYRYYNTYRISPNLYQGSIALSPTALYNPDFSWEETRKLEAGVQLGFAEDKVSIETSWYRNRSSNQLINVQLPATTGFSSVFGNLNAIVENYGWEGVLNLRAFQSENFSWTTAANISANRNKLIAFPDLENSPYFNIYKVGESLSVRMLYTYKGVNPETGEHELIDLNNDGSITDKDRALKSPTDRQYYGGLNNSFSFKAIELTFLFQFTKQYIFDYQFELPGSSRSNLPARVWDRWQNPGDITTMPKPTKDAAILSEYNRVKTSDYFITDASFIRLKTLTLSYHLPERWLNKIASDDGAIFLQGQNLLTFTNYTGFDPETEVSMPPLKIVTCGFKVNF